MRKGQPTIGTDQLRTGDRVIVEDMISRVVSLEKQGDGSIDVTVEPELDDNRTYNISFTHVSEPLWIGVKERHCGKPGRHLWHGHDFNVSPAWCSGKVSN